MKTKRQPKPVPMPNRPWAKREVQLRKKHGDYSDFVAWQHWFEEQNQNGYLDYIIQDASTTEQIFLYSAFCKCVEETVKASTR